MSEDVGKFIHERLFNDCEVVLYTDIMTQFQYTNNQAKKEMYKYYKTTKSKVNCVIVCCYAGGLISIIQDLANFEPSDDIVDAFIYAFSTMEQFTVVNKPNSRPLAIENAFEFVQKASAAPVEAVREPVLAPALRSKTKPEDVKTTEPARKLLPKAPVRAKTHPQESGKKEKSKDMGLQSTRLLQKMRQEREQREQERLQELRKRKERQMEKVANDPQRKKEMQELSTMFDDDSDDEDGEEGASGEGSAQPPITEVSSPDAARAPVGAKDEDVGHQDLGHQELGELLETTAEESLVEVPAPKEEPSTYVDDEGYIVTQRPAQRASSTPIKRKSDRTAPVEAKSEPPKKKVQKSLMSFFGKKK